MVTAVDRLTYAAAQTARVGWYFGQYFVSARLSRHALPRARLSRPTPGTGVIVQELRRLMARDWANIQAGRYRMPHDLMEPPGRRLAEAAAFFEDLPRVNARRRQRAGAEVFRAPPEGSGGLPRYYRQNFHFQTDGYLSARSARLYDHQVEVLFGGGADAMRRQALVPVFHHLASRPGGAVQANGAGARLLDLACGTGQFLTFVRDSFPGLDATGLDLSRPYLAEARRRLRRWPGTRLVQAAAEAVPAPDGAFDLVTCIFLFHELPRRVRAQVAAEIARLLRPGGQFVLLDSLQTGDRPEMDGLLEYFPHAFHEPYYADYLRHDLEPLFAAAGLRLAALDTGVFLSRMMVFEKP